MRKLSLLLLCLILLGCNAQKKIDRKVEKSTDIMYQYPERFSKPCSILYPVKDSTGKIVIKYLPADNSSYKNTTDSLNKEIEVLREEVSKDKDCDKYLTQINSLQSKVNSLQNRKVKPDTVEIDKLIYKENTAKVSDLQSKLSSVSNELVKEREEKEKYEKRSKNLLFYVISLGILFLGSAFLLFKKW